MTTNDEQAADRAELKRVIEAIKKKRDYAVHESDVPNPPFFMDLKAIEHILRVMDAAYDLIEKHETESG